MESKQKSSLWYHLSSDFILMLLSLNIKLLYAYIMFLCSVILRYNLFGATCVFIGFRKDLRRTYCHTLFWTWVSSLIWFLSIIAITGSIITDYISIIIYLLYYIRYSTETDFWESSVIRTWIWTGEREFNFE